MIKVAFMVVILTFVLSCATTSKSQNGTAYVSGMECKLQTK